MKLNINQLISYHQAQMIHEDNADARQFHAAAAEALQDNAVLAVAIYEDMALNRHTANCHSISGICQYGADSQTHTITIAYKGVTPC